MKIKSLLKSICIVCILLILCGIQSCASKKNELIEPDEQPIVTPEPGIIKYSEIIGSSHVIQRYYFGNKNCLNEGADRLLEMGSKVIKIWYYNGGETPDILYLFNSNWISAESLVEGLNNTHYSELFDKPFKTFVLNIASFVDKTNAYYWKDKLSQAQINQEEAEFYEFTKALLKKYEGTGKTFVLQHHEGDWHLRGNINPDIDPIPEALTRMTTWLNARQKGVTRARKEIAASNVLVSMVR